MTINPFWHFVSNQSCGIYGLNDGNIVQFSYKVIDSLVRECIQNSLDARIQDSNNPVTVEFSQFKINTSEFPDNNNFYEVLNKCYSSNQDDPDPESFFKNALNIFTNKLNIMRISDYNTTGLTGSDTCKKGSVWSRLVKEQGTSNKSSTSGGSFGIGKSATFACSDLRTVFYSSLDINNIESHIGVAKLISFEDTPNNWTTGIGYYSNNEKLTAIQSQLFFNNYNRTEPGTDIYIMGFRETEDLVHSIVKSVISNFLVSIWKGELIVKIQAEYVDKTTLEKHIAKLDKKKDKEIIDYYYLLASNDSKIKKINLQIDDYGKEYGFKDNDCTLYLMDGDNLNRKIMMTRSAGMRLFDQNRISGSINFTGILMINGTNMNKAFRAMEVPSHDAWEPGLCKGNEKVAEKMYKDLRKYMKSQVLNAFANTNQNEIDAFGANDFLPDLTIKSDSKQTMLNIFSDLIKEVDGKEMNPISKPNSKPKKRKKRKNNSKEVDIFIDDDFSGGDNPPTENNNGGKSGNYDCEKYPGNGDGNNPNSATEVSKGDSDTEELESYKEATIKLRSMCIDKKQGKYLNTFKVPKTCKYAKLEFSIVGEQSTSTINIKNSNLLEGNTSIKKIQGNTIYLDSVKKNDVLKIDLQLDFDEYCLLEVTYYENKK